MSPLKHTRVGVQTQVLLHPNPVISLQGERDLTSPVRNPILFQSCLEIAQKYVIQLLEPGAGRPENATALRAGLGATWGKERSPEAEEGEGPGDRGGADRPQENT